MSAMASGSRAFAILIKELIEMRRDPLTLAMILVMPLMQLILFGFAINNDPKHLPTIVHLEENTPIVRRIVSSMRLSNYFDIRAQSPNLYQSDQILAKGDASFVVSIPAGFTRSLIRGESPTLLIEADASDPSAGAGALSHLQAIVASALSHELTGSLALRAFSPDPVNIIVHRRYNPEAITQYNIVPGLLGVILTMTMVMITSMAMTRETERGTMENLLAMPSKPHEVMIGKIAPYILVGALQTFVVLLAAHFIFSVPFVGSMAVLIFGVMLFVLANLALGFMFSTIAQSQMQAMQLTFFFFLPSMLLSGFMFPFLGMPKWAQYLGEMLPLTHFLRIIRGVMLKGSEFSEVWTSFLAIAVFLLVVGVTVLRRYKQTLD